MNRERVGKYSLDREIGRGGSGIVYAARVDGDERPSIALKVGLAAQEGDGVEARCRFLEEADRLSRVDHPGVVRVVDAGELPDGAPFIAMELCEGEALADRVARGPMPVEEAMALFEDIAAGIEALHDVGLVHRDIKPENVMLTRGAIEGAVRPVLIDLGIAKDTARPPSVTTQSGVVRGTPACMAPERFFGQTATIATDVYEAALLFYVMVAGRAPWTDGADVDQRLDATSLADLAPVPIALSDVVMKALSRRVARRPASIRALVDEMRAAQTKSSARRWTAAVARRSSHHGTAAAPLPDGPSAAETGPPLDPTSRKVELVEPAALTRRSARRARLAIGAAAGGAAIALAFLVLRRSPSEAPEALASFVGDAPLASVDRSSEVSAAPAEPPEAPSSTPSQGASSARPRSTSIVESAPPSIPAAQKNATKPSVKGVPEACRRLVQYSCDSYGNDMCEGMKRSTESSVQGNPSEKFLAAWAARCEASLNQFIARDEPIRSSQRAMKDAPTCGKVKSAACAKDIVDDPATKPFCTQGEVFARSVMLMTTPEKAEASCATFLTELPLLVAQRRKQVAGDAAAKLHALEKYGLHRMPLPPPSASVTSSPPELRAPDMDASRSGRVGGQKESAP